MKRIFLFVSIMLMFCSAIVAQNISGHVIDGVTGTALYGANISMAGKETATDRSGNFFLPCSAAGSLIVSFVGYETRRQPVSSCTVFQEISLTPVGRNLDEVEITATSNLNKSLLYQPAAITRLKERELKRGTGLFLDDAINGNVPGVTMNRRAVSSGQQFNIRGYGNGSRGTRGISSNFDGQGYKVYLNGIPVTDAEGITVLDDIDFGSIGNVEVVKGPAGSLYGLAIAGVVNLKTMKPEAGKTSLGQDVLFGNYGLQRYTTHFTMGTDHSSLLLNYGHQKSDGFTIHNASRKDFVNVAGDFQPSVKQSFNAYFGYSNSYDERSGELTLTQYNNDDYSGNIEYIKRNAHSNVYSVRAGLGHIYKFNDYISNNTTVFGTSFNSNASSAGGWTDKSSTNLGLRSTFETKFSLRNNINLSGVTGVETQRQNAQTIGYTMIDPIVTTPAHVWKYGDPYFIIGATTSNVYTTTATTSAFTEWTLALPKDLSVTAGVGISNMLIKLDDRFYVANKPTHYDTTYKRMVSPHVAINKVFNKQFSLYGSYSKGYKAPVSAYFFIPFAAAFGPQTGIVNNKLKPEMANQFEIGSKGALAHGKISYELAFFNAIFSDKMTTVAVPYNSSTTLYSYVTNGGKQDNKGIEALVKYTVLESTKGFFRTVSPFANFTYSDFTYKNYPFHIIAPGNKDSIVDYSGKAVAGVAKYVANLGIDVSTAPGVYANVNYMYKDGMPITSDGINRTGSYNLLNAKLGIRRSISAHFDVDAFVGGNNLTNTKYPIMIFVNQLPDAYIAAPRNANYYGGLTLKYNF
ncbi:MAG: TonB-dependent receptor [Ferruginibacter sp.]|nr:TonB-dependent receptor [Ferruginibacter sp.]